MAKLQYQSGELVEQGDRVLYHGDSGQVEFVVNGLTGDPAMGWHYIPPLESALPDGAHRVGSRP